MSFNEYYEKREKDEVILEKKKWIQGAIDPDHKGFCTPMSKPTCTPHRKALAKRFKHGDLHKEGYQGQVVDMPIKPGDDFFHTLSNANTLIGTGKANAVKFMFQGNPYLVNERRLNLVFSAMRKYLIAAPNENI